MAYFTPVGSKFLYSTTFGSAVAVNSISNAYPAIANAPAHGFAPGAELLLKNGWEDVSDSIYRAGTGTAGSVITLDELDSEDTQWYPSGAASAGTVQAVSNWQEIGQVLDATSDGGGAKNIEYQPLALRNSKKMPTGFEAASFTLTLGYDPARADQKALNRISRNLNQRAAFKFLIAGGAAIYAYGTIQKSVIPQMSTSDVMKVTVSVNFDGLATAYVG